MTIGSLGPRTFLPELQMLHDHGCAFLHGPPSSRKYTKLKDGTKDQAKKSKDTAYLEKTLLIWFKVQAMAHVKCCDREDTQGYIGVVQVTSSDSIRGSFVTSTILYTEL